MNDQRACVRCGISRKVRTGRDDDLCRDCVSVVRDLHEIRKWGVKPKRRRQRRVDPTDESAAAVRRQILDDAVCWRGPRKSFEVAS